MLKIIGLILCGISLFLFIIFSYFILKEKVLKKVIYFEILYILVFLIVALILDKIEVKIKEINFKENVVLIDFENNLENDIDNLDNYKVSYDKNIILKVISIDKAIVKYKNGTTKNALVLFKDQNRIELLIQGRTYFLNKNN